MYPSLPQFTRWASHYNILPVWIEPYLPTQDFLEWTHQLLAGQSKFFLLHSAALGNQGRYSYFSLEAPTFVLQAKDQQLSIHYQAANGAHYDSLKVGNPVDRMHEWISGFRAPRVDGLPPFWGGLMGYFSYESAKHLDPRLKQVFTKPKRGEGPASPAGFHEIEFGLFDMVGVVDHIRRKLWFVQSVMLPESVVRSPLHVERVYRAAQNRLRNQAVRLQRALRAHRSWGEFRSSDVWSNCSQAAYQLMVRRAQAHIAAGDMYQCNLSQRFQASWKGNPWALYRHLTMINPSPYASLWRSGQRWIVSASPELLVRQEMDQLETRPIAGTYPRHQSDEDQALLHQFLRDIKEQAEHVMLVDLERNDLSRVCVSPSVKVAEALTVEAYSHVFHLVSDVRGQLMKGTTWKDVLRACFPGGTITGCPKIRCAEVIRQLEKEPRSLYTGSLGWINFHGDMTLNILIRSFFLAKDHMVFPVGAGIVADSKPAMEYQETLHKAAALMEALKAGIVDHTLPAPLTGKTLR